MRLCVDEVVVEDVLGCTNIRGDEAVILKEMLESSKVRRAYTYVKESLEPDGGTKLGHPFSFSVAGVGFCDDRAKMTFEPMGLVWAWDDPEWGEERGEICAKAAEDDVGDKDGCGSQGKLWEAPGHGRGAGLRERQTHTYTYTHMYI